MAHKAIYHLHAYWLLAVAVLFSAPLSFATEHTFTLDPRLWDDPPVSVHVAGTFNGWSKDANPMQADRLGVYSATLDLPEGVHRYKFVIDGERWVQDPGNDDAELQESDGHGGMNSGILVGFDARTLDPPAPNAIKAKYVVHMPDEDLRVVATGRMMLISARAQADDVRSASVTVHKEGGDPRTIELPLARRELGWDHFAALIPVSQERVGYTLEMVDGDARVVVGQAGASSIQPGDDKPEPFVTDVRTDFQTPDWAKEAVWYQVFPERFRNGTPENDPGAFWFENLLPWTCDWWASHPAHGEVAGDDNFYHGKGNVWKRRYGGDFQGLQASLPYLRKLGVNAIYLNPVFEADSMHKYDTSDFRHIDDNFGVKGDLPIGGETDDPSTWQWSDSDKVFLAFIEEAHAQGFKVIIDGVFNHVGRSHPFFMDVLIHGKDSRYADWFEITDWGDPSETIEGEDGATPTIEQLMAIHGKPGGIQWRAWDGDNGHLPVFRKDPELGLAEGPREHIFHITERWLAPDGDPSKGVDGFRLDVPQDIPHPFWRDWRKHVKKINPDAYITGEIWSFALPWLNGDQFDATMNYPFAMVAQDFFADRHTAISPTTFGQRLTEVAYAYPLQVSLVQMNLFDSHDTDRLASMVVNPDLPYDGLNRLQDTGPDYSRRVPNADEWRRVKLMVTCQMTFLGAPMIYYGSEAGMFSPDDPSNRMPMLWEDLGPYKTEGMRFNQNVFDHYQRMIALRSALPALRQGFFRVVSTHDKDGTFVYDRFLEDQHVYVALNRSENARWVTIQTEALEEGSEWVDLMVTRNARVEFEEEGKQDERPRLLLEPNAKTLRVKDGKLRVRVPSDSAAVLVRKVDLDG